MPAVMPSLQQAGSTLGQYPSFGLAMRFQVTVDDLTDLGLWQSCAGLKVELKYKAVEQGGQYTQVTQLPDKLAYGPVTLERAVEARSSTQVQAWLAQYVQGWRVYPRSPGAIPPSTNVTIRLLDYQLLPVMTWTLQYARPSKWELTTLSAKDSKVAIEVLSFEHEGFLQV